MDSKKRVRHHPEHLGPFHHTHPHIIVLAGTRIPARLRLNFRSVLRSAKTLWGTPTAEPLWRKGSLWEVDGERRSLTTVRDSSQLFDMSPDCASWCSPVSTQRPEHDMSRRLLSFALLFLPPPLFYFSPRVWSCQGVDSCNCGTGTRVSAHLRQARLPTLLVDLIQFYDPTCG